MERRGFTLIELLVVIAIIAILAAILFPVFARAREKARQTSCLNNVKEITLGLKMYSQDYDEMMPETAVGAPSWVAPAGDTCIVGLMPWVISIYPYLKNTQIWNCPSVSAAWSGDQNFQNVTYAINYYACGVANAKFNFVAETCVLADAEGGDADWNPLNGEGSIMPSLGANCDSIAPRHNEGANIGFFDGHAKWLKSNNSPRAGRCSRFWRPTAN
mgnify:CR=1 FL=1